MYQVMNASPLTVIVVMAAMMVTPIYALGAYVASNASYKKGALIGAGFLVWGAFMSWFCLAGVTFSIGPIGRLIVPACWAGPTIVLLLYRSWFLDRPLSQRWLIGVQLWRAIGGVFLIEMSRQNMPGIFAYPAGVGDLFVAGLTAFVLVRYRNQPAIPRVAVLLVIGFGLADFLSAFFFGFTSSPGPQQLFFPTVVNNSLLFPTGLIPLFLVPCTIFFHALSWLELRRPHASVKVPRRRGAEESLEGRDEGAGALVADF
jgi:hypothetical protein